MFLIDIFKVVLNIVYIPFKFLKTKNKILFLSRQSNKPSLEYNYVINGIREKDSSIEIVTITKMLEKNIFSYITNFVLFFKQMYHIATSKVVVVDGYSILISILKHRSNLVVVQLWHANGIIKKIGLQTLSTRTEKDRKLAIKMNMHKNYTYVISSSSETSKVFKEAFGVNDNQIKNYGTPMLDYIYNKENDKGSLLRKKYNLSTDKKMVLYLPTYRKYEFGFEELLKNFDFKNYQLVIKTHPIVKFDSIDSRVVVMNEELAEDVISVADYVITDYSNVAFEAILSGKKTYFYVSDYNRYRNKCGFNIELKKEIKKYTFAKFKHLMNCIKEDDYDMNLSNKFANKYIENFDGKSTNRIVEFLVNLIKC